MKESRNRYLIKNTAIFTLGNIGSKIISFFLIPLYTNALSTAEYGIVDLIATITAVAGPIITLNIGESVMRFGLDKDSDKEKITQIGFVVFLFAIISGFLLIPICTVFEQTNSYSIYIYMYVISSAGSHIFLCDLRGKELLLKYSIGNIIQTFLIAILNIALLVNFGQGVKGYLVAYIVANTVVCLYAIVAGKSRCSFSFKKIDKAKMKQMIIYSTVLIPNTFMWWIMNSSDRLMVTSMIGISANGIYAISYKIPTLVSTLTTIFNQAWSYSAIRELGNTDEIEYNNKVFKYLVSVVMLIGIGLLAITKPFLSVFVAEDYYEAWRYVPFLLVGCVFLTFGSFMATSYTVHKDSKGFLYSGIFGACLNIILNFLLIPTIQIYGAAFATCVSYISVFVFRLVHTRKYIRYNVLNKEFIIGSILLVSSAIAVYIENGFGIVISFIICILAFCFYSKTWLPLFKAIIHKVHFR